MVTLATSEEFRDLKDPYTGGPLNVVMRASPSGPEFYAPRATSPRDFSKGGPVKCPYTGESFVVREIAGRTILLGGFDPRIPQPRENFLYYAAMRGGVSPYPAPMRSRVEAAIRKGRVTRRHQDHADRSAPKLTDYHVHAVEKSLSRFKDRLPGSPTVSMFTGRRP